MCLADKKKCTGCTACVNACPIDCLQMITDIAGFPYPTLVGSSKCTECGLCAVVCPVTTQQKVSSNLPTAYAAYSIRSDIRSTSSSGGIFTELAFPILEADGVVYGAAYDEAFHVHHICAETLDELNALRGAKYAQSDLKSTFQEIQTKLRTGQVVLFSGTPCQVAGLKSFLKTEYDSLICVDFVCHGVPSPMAWQEYVKHRSNLDNQGVLPKAIDLRSKASGWSHYQYSTAFEYGDTRYSCVSGDSLYMKLFVGDYINRPACESCNFRGYERVGDITLGDFWGIWDIDPQMDDNKGTSVLLVQSDKGAKLLAQIEKNLRVKEVTLEQASQQNPSMIVSSVANPNCEDAMRKILNGDFADCDQFFLNSSTKTTLFGKIAKRIFKR